MNDAIKIFESGKRKTPSQGFIVWGVKQEVEKLKELWKEEENGKAQTQTQTSYS